jgi:hypothetical protein
MKMFRTITAKFSALIKVTEKNGSEIILLFVKIVV